MTSESKEEMKPIPNRVFEVESYMKERVGLGISFDLGVRKITALKKEIHFYYVTGLVDTSFLIEILEGIVGLNERERSTSKVYEIVHNRIVHQQVKEVETLDEMVVEVLSGLIAIVVDGTGKALIVDVRSYPGRMPQEPDTEKTVRGSRDGYVENIIINTALTRRRIRDERLRIEIMKVGERSKTDISICYINGIVDPDMVDIIRKELKNISLDGLTMADKTVEEYIVKQGYNPYPLVRYTERADVAATHLFEGHVIIIVDNSPSVIITPTTIFHHMQHAEEYRQSPAVGTLIRLVRFLGVFSSLFLLPFWLLFTLDPSLLPESLAFIGPNKETNIPIVIQIFIADFGLEFLRMAAIHTPTPLSTAMGLIAAVLIGQIAIDVGLFVPEVILYVSVAAIGTYATPSLELSLANKISRLFLMIVTAIFHIPGFMIGTTVYFILLASIKTLNTPYLWPLVPFYPKALSYILLRRPVPGSRIRPSIVHPRDKYRQPR
ncbi:spore germination protein [Peribacillus cavernae]|uniref:Spore germination protein n=1 Tax=Peribacillus cavernae TaxID=1674310 RepID=A0A3S0W3C7_9BACI|nr:spore germination protein [Peribacillus cavernae]MDQ0219050.1 stage V sporulation protein AF [Peribacillus cavernae]RUQ26504.1 spore germination protein [Peribacillus cavernae]